MPESSSLATPGTLIEAAFRRLSEKPGFVSRPDQLQLALLISDMIAGGSSGLFEAPTGLGKSLAAIVPAIAHAAVSGRRTVIATYTNVLAEQYWRKDLPLAMSLFDFDEDVSVPRTQFLIGRQRYACLAAMDEHAPDLVDALREGSALGIESEFRSAIRRPARELTALWQKVVTPPVCPGRLCPAYDDCFYYRARRGADSAAVIITNHSVVLQHAIMCRDLEDDSGLLGKYDFLVLDEAHDFPTAAINGLEFELSPARLQALVGVSGRLESTAMPIAERCGDGLAWTKLNAAFRQDIDHGRLELEAYGATLGRQGILTACPSEVLAHPQVEASLTNDDMEGAKRLAVEVSDACENYVKGFERCLSRWRDEMPEGTRLVSEASRSYGLFLREYGIGCFRLFAPEGVAVSYVGRTLRDTFLRQDTIDLSIPLRELIWERTPSACLSATLAVDGNFDYFRRTTGCEPAFEEILPSPFDFSTQAALYLPALDTIPDPTVARKNGTEDRYFHSVARELSKIIIACEGRTLALFHSRREMEAVAALMDLPPSLPILLQRMSNAAATGDRFREDTQSSLFALRSFWTGFDAPGETLSCVALVRVPFEVPFDPPQITRLAWMQQQGHDAFRDHTLALAKMMMRQGAGRLIRRGADRGIIAILDPRIQTKRYGEEILANLPPEMRTFRDINDAVGWIGLTTGNPGR